MIDHQKICPTFLASWCLMKDCHDRWQKGNMYVKEELLSFIRAIACPIFSPPCNVVKWLKIILLWPFPDQQRKTCYCLWKGLILWWENEMNCRSIAQIQNLLMTFNDNFEWVGAYWEVWIVNSKWIKPHNVKNICMSMISQELWKFRFNNWRSKWNLFFTGK